MLSRVAQNVYWMARYLERTEDTARLISVNAILLLDLPRNTAFGWEPLVFITGGEKLFYENNKEPDELSVIKFLIGERNNPASIISSLSFARENLRTTRDVVPREAWEQINDLHLYVRDRLEMGMSRRGRFEFLRTLIRGIQQITGLLDGAMSRTHAYEFIGLGRYLERADMTTRILDVRSANLVIRQSQEQSQNNQNQNQNQSSQSQELNPFDSIQWMSVLKSLSAYQMYRQRVRLRVSGPDVLKFLLQDPLFPRALYFCLSELELYFRELPKNTALLQSVAHLKENVTSAQVPNLSNSGLHDFMDELQVGLGDIHEQLHAAYFGH
jgi:uncharacterized alpha-E superfamily protein